ncbi:uncharacterized protein LOC127870243 [Dreissena polymorpha]|uniref:Uncharacterized protein n=1 Tax=Dreissena polymorpha TaxID=45954 RepID=A0A9D4RB51_DREPO|nr:uncharacterized protein LOC127870243 [Dreissena polymorpha]KAH3861901.1 hypothetical protein DPMN_024855 [Dreissena polymorpha]
MTTRVTSPDSSSSAGELPNVSGLSKASPHPEEWTLPHEWNIEKREMYDNWKMDVQNQISNLAVTLKNSLQKHPRPEVAMFDYSDAVADNEVRKQLMGRERQAGNTLIYGLARVPPPDKAPFP